MGTHLLLYRVLSVEKNTTKKVVEYFPALTRCGKASLLSRYRRRHCQNRPHAGTMFTAARVKMNHFVDSNESVERVYSFYG